MNDAARNGCPRVEDVSAVADGSAGAEVERHVRGCPACAALLREFAALSAAMRPLRQVECDVDLATLVAPRLPRRKPPRARWLDVLQLAPRGLAGAAALAAGAYLGVMLTSGAAVAMRPAAMTVFDATPPGALCAGHPACAPRGK